MTYFHYNQMSTEPNVPNSLTVGRRATARLEEAILLALEEHRDQGYLNTLRLAERIGWDNDGMPSRYSEYDEI